MAMITLGTALSHDDNICAATGKDWYTAYPRKIQPNHVHHRQLTMTATCPLGWSREKMAMLILRTTLSHDDDNLPKWKQ